MILEENAGAIFTNENILRVDLDGQNDDPDKYDERLHKLISSMDTVVVGVDPNVVEDEKSDETGIVVAGRKGDKAYIFKDASRRGKISDIYKEIVTLYYRYNATSVVVETNNGGDFIPAAIYNIDPMVVVEKVFASKGKRARAEPIGLLYERHKVYHVGIHMGLESQMTNYNPQVDKKSPDRLDALVWCLTKLFPASMRGLFSSSNTEDAYQPLSKQDKITDLNSEVYSQNNELDNPYGLDTGSDINDDYSLI